MRRNVFTKLSNPLGNATKQTILSSSSSAAAAFPFSTFSGDGGGRGSGRGRGRGRSSDFPNPNFFNPTNPGNIDSNPDYQSPPSPLGRGHGRGQPSQPPPRNPSFNRSQPVGASAHGRGRGIGGGPTPFTRSPPPPPLGSIETETLDDSISRKPIFLKTEEQVDSISTKPIALMTEAPVDSFPRAPSQPLPLSIFSITSDNDGGLGRGRGKPVKLATEKPTENRHIRSRSPPSGSPPSSGNVKAIGERESSAGPKLSREEALNRARSVLSRGGDDGGSGGGGDRGSNVVREGRGGRGRGRGRGRSGRRGGGRGRGRGGMDYSDEDDDGYDETKAMEAEQATEEEFRESFVKDFGSEKADMILEAFEEATDNALPSPMEDTFVDAMDTNYMIECEPEYLMNFENPDIDDKPPMPLRHALEKMKPFLMAYEDIRTDEEWEEVVKETMDNVPLMKKIVDDYGGPDKATAKQEQEELERVAKTLPESAPNSVKRFTDRAVLSLQSNPGWEFYKKYGFMDKLVQEVSKSYK